MKNNKIIPLLSGFFVMGFVDLVGIATNHIKVDFNLTDSFANIIPMMVFVWFAICSIPTGVLMNKYGKKQLLLSSMVLTSIATLLPFISYSYEVALFSFALIGIGNTILQVSLNPMTAAVVKKEKVTSILTWGQFIKAISSFLGPILVSIAIQCTGNWKTIFPIYSIITLITMLWIWIEIPNVKEEKEVMNSSFIKILQLLKNRYTLVMFLGILIVVGIDVGMNVGIPQLLIERSTINLSKAGLGISVYFAAKICGTFVGAIVLNYIKSKSFFKISMLVAFFAYLVLLTSDKTGVLLGAIFVIGFACANVFSIIFSNVLNHLPNQSNGLSALMIMGIAGGAVVMPIMGTLTDYYGITVGLSILIIGILYLYYLATRHCE